MNALRPTTDIFCLECDTYYERTDLMNRWTCPTCNAKLKIKVESDTANHSYECLKVLPNELRIGELIILDNGYRNQILDIRRENSEYNIALKGYRVIKYRESDIITKINGRWCHN